MSTTRPTRDRGAVNPDASRKIRLTHLSGCEIVAYRHGPHCAAIAQPTQQVFPLTAVEAKPESVQGSLMKKRHPIRPHLRAWRIHFDETLEGLAEKLRISHSTIQRWETGAIGVDDKQFAEIARVYGITLAELSEHPSERERMQKMDQVLQLVRDLDAEGLAAVATLASRLKR